MSLPDGLESTNKPEAVSPAGSSDHGDKVVRDLEVDNDSKDIHPSDSSSSSNSSTLLQGIKSSIELPTKRMRNPCKKSKYLPKRRYRGTPRGKPNKFMMIHDKNRVEPKMLEITSGNSTEYVSNDYFKFKDVGNVNCKEPFVCSLYITSYNGSEEQHATSIPTNQFTNTVNSIAMGKVRIQKTFCGIIVAFTREQDADKIMTLPLQNIFSRPVQVAKFQTGEHRFSQNVLFKDIPWCISNVELHQALKMQGLVVGTIIRTRSYVKVELLNALDVHRLIEEGLNFFNYVTFLAVPDNSATQCEPDIVQCFKCQGFWHTSTHCRQMPRCVRCGDNHDVEYCPRPRNSPICCHCGGPHHAAYKMCPVRLQHISSTYLGFQLAKNKPAGSIAHNAF